MPQQEEWDWADELAERELRPLTEEEAEALARADAAWLAREHAEHEALTSSLEEELAALLATIERGEPSSDAQPDPPGWPNL
jgi:hypothetical protein